MVLFCLILFLVLLFYFPFSFEVCFLPNIRCLYSYVLMLGVSSPKRVFCDSVLCNSFPCSLVLFLF